MKTRLLSVVSMLAILLGLLPGAVHAEAQPAQVVVPVMGTLPEVYQVTVNDSPSNQTDPHLSGDWVSYIDYAVSGIHFQNLDLGFASDRIIPHPDNNPDSQTDISGNTIVFTRGGAFQRIYMVQINPFGNPGDAIEVSPTTTDPRQNTAVGGDTIAFRVCIGGSPCGAENIEIGVSSVSNPTAPAYILTNDGTDDIRPAVSSDGNAVVWVKCQGNCGSWEIGDIWRAERTNGVWGAPERVTSSNGQSVLPDTDGPVTVYDTDDGVDRDIRWSVKDASGAYVESVLDLPGDQMNPSIAGNLIVYYGNNGTSGTYDIYLYDIATNRLYQLTNTPTTEFLADVSSGPGGLVRVAWTQMVPAYPYEYDIYAMSFILDTTAPVATPNISGTLGENGWYTGDVSLTWSVTDDQSELDSMTGCDPTSITGNQAATDYTCSADSDGGTSHATVSIQRDATEPVTAVTGVAEGASYELGSVPQAGCTTTDALSGVATEATVTLSGGDAQGAGSITATCSGALDAAGNAADPAAIHFTVTNPASATYTFTGFFQPVDNPGDGPSWVYNSVKAGAAIPVKFSLNGDQGLDIFAAGFPKTQSASCAIADVMNPIEETVAAGSSSLSYDAASDTYTYVWKTNKLWAGTCRALNVTLDDGTQHLAYFRFK